MFFVTLVVAITTSLTFIFAGAAHGQPYPNRPIRVVVGLEPGGSADINARAVTAQLQSQIGTVVVENRAGAGGIIAYDFVAKAKPDGYTLLFFTTSFVSSVATYPKLPFDPLNDFSTVTLLSKGVGNVVVVNPTFPTNSLKELIALAKNRDKPLTYGSPGHGTAQHFVGELFNMRAGIKLVHVPYKGQAPTLTAVLSREVDVAFMQPPGGVDLVKSGKLRALGFAGQKRWEGLPDVPTLEEAGIHNFEIQGPFNGVLVPARTPEAIVTRLHTELSKAIVSPQVRAHLESGGTSWPDGSGPAEFREFLTNQIKRYMEIARATGIVVK